VIFYLICFADWRCRATGFHIGPDCASWSASNDNKTVRDQSFGVEKFTMQIERRRVEKSNPAYLIEQSGSTSNERRKSEWQIWKERLDDWDIRRREYQSAHDCKTNWGTITVVLREIQRARFRPCWIDRSREMKGRRARGDFQK
jgi:hypothetical protein